MQSITWSFICWTFVLALTSQEPQGIAKLGDLTIAGLLVPKFLVWKLCRRWDDPEVDSDVLQTGYIRLGGPPGGQ